MAGGQPDPQHGRRVHLDGDVHAYVQRSRLPEPCGGRQCWTFLTEGLAQLGQQDVFFSIVDTSKEPPPEAITFLRSVSRQAQRGNIVHSGGRTRFGEHGLYGDWTGIGYVSTLPSLGLPIAEDVLIAAFLLRGEVDVVEHVCLGRVLARLGDAYRFFPFPWWSERSRQAVVDETWITKSTMRGVRKAAMPCCTTLLANGRLVMTCSAEASARFKAIFAEARPGDPVALLTRAASHADAHLVWKPGQRGPAAIAPRGAQGAMTTGSFVLLLPRQAQIGAQIYEDGFVLWLTDDATDDLRTALIAGKSTRIVPTDQLFGFEVGWS